jgi:hypothetical protein
LFGKTNKISLFEGSIIRRFADIHEATSAIVSSRKKTFSRNLVEEKGMKADCYQDADNDEQNV